MNPANDTTLPRDQDAPARGSARTWWAVTLALIAIGVGLRVWRALFAGLPLRVDEIRVAWNLFERNLAQLAKPLDHHQAAPVGFLWLVDTAVEWLGRDAWALRLIPLIAGLSVIALIPLCARRVTGKAGLMFAIALTALAPGAIQYSSDLKQYSMDVLCTAIVLLTALNAIGPNASTRSRLAFTLAACTALFFSHPAALVIAGFGLTLFSLSLFARRWRVAIEWAVAGAIISAELAALWWINLRHISGRDDLTTYWARDFMPLPPKTWDQAAWFPRAIVEWINTSGFFYNPLVLVLAGAGLFALRRRPAHLILLISPIVITLAACAAQAYPFSGRMIVFLMPCTVAILAVGFQSLTDRLGFSKEGQSPQATTNPGKGEWIAIAIILLCFAVTLPFSQIARPWVGGRYDLNAPFSLVEQKPPARRRAHHRKTALLPLQTLRSSLQPARGRPPTPPALLHRRPPRPAHARRGT